MTSLVAHFSLSVEAMLAAVTTVFFVVRITPFESFLSVPSATAVSMIVCLSCSESTFASAMLFQSKKDR